MKKINTPTKITIIRIIMTVIMIVSLITIDFLSKGNEEIRNFFSSTIPNTPINVLYLIVMVFFVLASISDFFDGYLARKYNQVTDLGKFLDPVADKLLVNSIILFLMVSHPFASSQMEWPLLCGLIIIVRDTVVDAIRFIAASKNLVIAANIFGKLKTVLEMIAIPLILLNGWPFSYFDSSWGMLRISYIFVYLATIASFVSGVIYIVQNRHVLKEDETKDLLKYLEENNLTLGSCESITGGLFASSITKIKGSSKVYKGSIISYSNEIKESVVHVDKEIIDKFGVVSEEVAVLMAKNAKKILNVDIAVSCTGNAGPTVCDNKPVGRVYIAIADKNGIRTKELNLSGDRNKIQQQVVKELIFLIKD